MGKVREVATELVEQELSDYNLSTSEIDSIVDTVEANLRACATYEAIKYVRLKSYEYDSEKKHWNNLATYNERFVD